VGNVIAFPKRPDTSPPSMATPMPAYRWADTFFDRGQWRLSKKGNNYVVVDGFCVTVFHRPGGFAWCIASDAKHKPLWSDRTFSAEREARTDAFDVLATLAEAEGR
jgi:hypothetical protein